MEYKVISGDCELKVNKRNPRDAAIHAIRIWNYKLSKPNLTKITTVIDSKKQEVHLLTSKLIEEIS